MVAYANGQGGGIPKRGSSRSRVLGHLLATWAKCSSRRVQGSSSLGQNDGLSGRCVCKLMTFTV